MSSLDLPVSDKPVARPTVTPNARRPLPTRWISVLTLATLMLAWWLVTAAGWIEPLFLSSPADILAKAWSLLTQGYMDAMGVPGSLLPLVIALEIGGGLAVLAGLFTRWSALSLAAFSVASGVLFHFDLADANQFNSFFKNIAIAGGFLVLAAQGAGDYSLDRLLQRKPNRLAHA